MNPIIYVIIFFGIMIISNMIHNVFSKVPLPLIQLILGAVIGLISSEQVLRLDPHIFLSLVIAPLLFREGEESDTVSILKHWRVVIFLAFILVIITVFSIGLTTHALLKNIPLAACFAVGAALGPTDLVTMSSLSQSFHFPKWVTNVLKGEGLINDASGLIAFYSSLTVITTKHFSLTLSIVGLVVATFGGILVGVIISHLAQMILHLLDDLSANDLTMVLLFELTLPLISFFVAEHIVIGNFTFSGIISAVTAGIIQSNQRKKIRLFDAKIEAVQSTTWDILNFAMNSIVFIMLGLELERIIFPLLKRGISENLTIFITIILVTIVLFSTRLFALVAYYRLISLKRHQVFTRYFTDILLLTFSGVKGTVSLATILLTPIISKNMDHDDRPTMLVIVAGVALCSFLTGLIILPMLGEKKNIIIDHRTEIAILEDVMMQLEGDASKLKNRVAMDVVIDNYRVRVRDLIIDSESEDIKHDLYDLRFMMLQVEMEGLEEALDQGMINGHAYQYYISYIVDRERSILARNSASTINFLLLSCKRIFFALTHIRKIILKKKTQRNLTATERQMVRDVYIQNTELILKALEELEFVYDPILVDYLQSEQIRMVERLDKNSFIEQLIIKARPNNIEEMMRGFYLERKVIFEYQQQGLLVKKKALELQKNVNLLESYSLHDNYQQIPIKFMNLMNRNQM